MNLNYSYKIILIKGDSVRRIREWTEYGELTHSTEVNCNLLR